MPQHHFSSSHFSNLPSITIIIIFNVPVNTMMSDAIFIVIVLILSDYRCLASFLRQAAVLLCLRWELWETLGRRVFKSRTLLCTPVSLLKWCYWSTQRANDRYTDHLDGQLTTMSSSGNRSTGPVLRGPSDQHVGAPDRDGDPRRLQHLAHSSPLSGHCFHWLALLSSFKVEDVMMMML